MESFGAALRRRFTHLSSHPIAWARYVWRRELRQQEVTFLENPRFSDWEPMYRVARPGLVRLLGRSSGQLDGYFGELAAVHAALVREAGAVPSAGALMQAPLLYVAVRALEPERVIETGISSGYSARLLLEALARNGHGHLDSIGVDVFAMRGDAGAARSAMGGRPVGWLVPERLKDRWTLHLGRSEERLPPLLADGSPPVDLFLHDSLHQYATMRFEYESAWPRLSPTGLLASHDVHANAAWPEFLRAHGLEGDEELDHDLGLVRVPAR